MKVKCPICGAPLENESCSYCGFVIEHSTTTEIDVLHGISRKSRMEALLLCIFLGGIGGHQFYVGKSWDGNALCYKNTGVRMEMMS